MSKKNVLKNTVFIISLLFLFFIFAKGAFAQGSGTSPFSDPNQQAQSTYQSSRFNLNTLAKMVGLGNVEDDPRDVLLRLIQYALGFTSMIALSMVIYGGLTWATAAGKEDRVQSGKRILIWSAIGLMTMVTAWSVITYVMYILSQVI